MDGALHAKQAVGIFLFPYYLGRYLSSIYTDAPMGDGR